MASGHIDLTLKFFQDGDLWIGVCLELNTSTYGDSFEEVKEDLQAQVRELLEVCEEAGELEEKLFLSGVVPRPEPVDPESIHIEQFHLNLGAKNPAETPAGG